MAQSVWTVFSAAAILSKFYKQGIEAHITAAGDNQVILFELTLELGGRKLQRCIERIIESSASEIGHKTKPEVTFTSRTATEFNKNTFIHGKKASQGTKKASRIGGDAEEIIPSINSKLTGIYSTGVSVAGESESPRGAFVACLFESLIAIREMCLQCSEDIMLAMQLCSRALGELKINLYPSFCVRGILDMLTVNAALWMFISPYRNEFPRQYRAIKSQILESSYGVTLVKPLLYPSSRT